MLSQGIHWFCLTIEVLSSDSSMVFSQVDLHIDVYDINNIKDNDRSMNVRCQVSLIWNDTRLSLKNSTHMKNKLISKYQAFEECIWTPYFKWSAVAVKQIKGKLP